MDLNKLSAEDLALLLAELEQEDETLSTDVARIERSIELVERIAKATGEAIGSIPVGVVSS